TSAIANAEKQNAIASILLGEFHSIGRVGESGRQAINGIDSKKRVGAANMSVGLTETSFEKLLDCLAPDREQAGAAYEALRRKLTRFFEWRGAPYPEEHVDETFNRVARKLEEGVQILNPSGYCSEVARLVLLESLKGPERKLTSLEAIDPRKASMPSPSAPF